MTVQRLRRITGHLRRAVRRRPVVTATGDGYRIAQDLGVATYRGLHRPDGFTFIDRGETPRMLGMSSAVSDADLDALWRSRVVASDARRHEAQTGYAALARADRISCRYRVRPFSGGERVFEERAIVRERRPDGTIVVDGVVIDVSAAAAAADLHRLLDDITDTLGVYVYEGEISADGAYLETYTGAGFERMLGIERPREALGDDAWEEHIHPDDRAAYVAWDPVASGTESITYRVVDASGRVRHVAEWCFVRERLGNGAVRVEGALIDLTEQTEARDALRDVEQRFGTVLAATDLLISTVRAYAVDNVVEVFRGPGMERLLGGRPAEGEEPWKVWYERIHADDRPARDAALERVLDGESASMVYRLRGLDDVERWIWVRAIPRTVRDADGGVIIDRLFADVSERERAIQALANARDEAERQLRLDQLTGVANRLGTIEALEQMLDQAPEQAGPFVLLLDVDHFKRINDTYLHAAGDEVLCEIARRLAAAVGSEGLVARFGGEEFAVVFPGWLAPDSLRARAEQVRRAVAAGPIAVAGEQLHVTLSGGLARAEAGTWSTTSVLAAADRALYAAKRRGRNRLVAAADVAESDVLADEPDAIRMAEAVSHAAALREGESEVHCHWVADTAGSVAARIGLGPAAQLRCRLAGLLHDIGKVAIPDAILAKPGPLDDAEWQVMRQHAAFGAEILSRISGLADAAPIVRHHHERVDGSGYPAGLAGDAIPIESRIVAVVDAYSAMVEARVYCAPRSHTEAVAELRRCSGSHFDATVVEALVEVLAERRRDAA